MSTVVDYPRQPNSAQRSNRFLRKLSQIWITQTIAILIACICYSALFLFACYTIYLGSGAAEHYVILVFIPLLSMVIIYIVS
jgi:hypothetical protein